MTKGTKDIPRKPSRKPDPRSSGEHRGHTGHPETGARHETEEATDASRAEHAHATGMEEPGHRTEDVLHAFRKGRADAIEAAERTLPAVKKSVSKGTYMLCYYLSFGAIYTAELAMAAVPEDSVIRHGFRDGAAAAKEAHAHRQTIRGHHAAPDAAV